MDEKGERIMKGYGEGRCEKGPDCTDPECVKAGHPGVVPGGWEQRPTGRTQLGATGRAPGYVAGFCPMSCGETLYLGAGGHVTCAWFTCPDPVMVDRLLNERETDHLAVFEGDGFTIMHPLRERVGGGLMECPLHLYLVSLAATPVGPGRYRVEPGTDAPPSWRFERTGGESETEMENGHG